MRTNTFRLSSLALLLIFFAACQSQASTPAAPTATVETVIQAATPTVSSAIESDLMLAGHSMATGQLAFYQDVPLTLTADDPSTNIFAPLADPNPDLANFVLGVDVQWESGEDGLNGCDIIFRSELDLISGRQLLFETIRFSGIYPPNWGFYLISAGQIEEDLVGGVQFRPGHRPVQWKRQSLCIGGERPSSFHLCQWGSAYRDHP